MPGHFKKFSRTGIANQGDRGIRKPNYGNITKIPVVCHINNMVHLQETITATKIGTAVAVGYKITTTPSHLGVVRLLLDRPIPILTMDRTVPIKFSSKTIRTFMTTQITVGLKLEWGNSSFAEI